MTKEGTDQNHSPLNERILFGLARIGQAIRVLYQKQAAEEQLSPTQAQALIFISQGVNVPSEIADRLKITRASLSDSLSSLIEKGLVRRSINPEDSRSFHLELTAKGKRRSLTMAKWPEGLLETVEDLTENEKAVLLKGITKIIVELQEQGLVSVPAMCATCQYFKPYAHSRADKPHHCNFTNTAFSDAELRLDCSDNLAAEERIKF